MTLKDGATDKDGRLKPPSREEQDMTHFAVGEKVFETEKEASRFSKDLLSHGALAGWRETTEPVTHYYLGNLMTEPIEDYFGLIKEDKESKEA